MFLLKKKHFFRFLNLFIKKPYKKNCKKHFFLNHRKKANKKQSNFLIEIVVT